MRKSPHRRPELESLESVLLLSTVSAQAHHAAKTAAHAKHPTQLVGTFPLTIVQSSEPTSPGQDTVFTGQGKLAGFGRVKIEAAIAPGTPTPGPIQGFVTLSKRHSMAGWDTTLTLPANGASSSMPYSIDNDEADGVFVHENNTTGTVTLSNIVAADGTSSYVLTLS